MVGRGGTVSLTGLPPGAFPLSIFDTVLNGITVRGSIVRTRLDLQEALQFAAQGKVRSTVETAALEDINFQVELVLHRGHGFDEPDNHGVLFPDRLARDSDTVK